jgi:hypothetical protein
LFATLFLHQLAHCSLVWYRKGSCDSLKLDGIEAGEYYEKTVFGGVSCCEVEKEDLQITQVGFYKGPAFYPLSES